MYAIFLTATAVQHVCLAKTLMMIREIEVYDGSKLLTEQRLKTKVCPESYQNPQRLPKLSTGINFRKPILSLRHYTVRGRRTLFAGYGLPCIECL